ncbi:transposase family protein [Longimycelium tulufanense]|uniref:transposase family protein n=1 Tax=Longimycelium tulufanense TaxID=907463 RepID=UPI0035710D8E
MSPPSSTRHDHRSARTFDPPPHSPAESESGDAHGRLLFCGAWCRGSTPDITQARKAGRVDWLEHTCGVEILTDAGYPGLGAQTAGQVITPTVRSHKKRRERMPDITKLRATQRKAHAARRIRVEHAIAHLKNWRALTHHHGRRDTLPATPSAPSPADSPTTNTPTTHGSRSRPHRMPSHVNPTVPPQPDTPFHQPCTRPLPGRGDGIVERSV